MFYVHFYRPSMNTVSVIVKHFYSILATTGFFSRCSREDQMPTVTAGAL